MPKIILCRGIQGSGKTTWAKQWVLEDPEHRVDSIMMTSEICWASIGFPVENY